MNQSHKRKDSSTPMYFESVRGINKLDLTACVLHYRETKDEHTLRVILYKLRPTLNYYLYHKTNYADKAELTAAYEDKLLDCINSYKEDAGTKFLTYYCRCLDNVLYRVAKYTNPYNPTHDATMEQNEIAKRQFNNPLGLEYKHYHNENDSIDKYLGREDSYDRLDVDCLLRNLKPVLDDNEFKVCEIILNNPHKLKYREIANEMNLTLSAIPYILKRLKKKFKNGTYPQKFIKSL